MTAKAYFVTFAGTILRRESPGIVAIVSATAAGIASWSIPGIVHPIIRSGTFFVSGTGSVRPDFVLNNLKELDL